MKIYAAPNHVILRKVEEDEEIHGNIIIADIDNKRPMICKIVEMGDETVTPYGFNRRLSLYYSVGDKVFIPSFSGHKVTIDNEDFIISDYESILGKII